MKVPPPPEAQRSNARTLGPISDLERHLPQEWWRTLFNAVYLKTDGDVVENNRTTENEVDVLIRIAGLGKGDRILDLCCGQGRHTIELGRRGFKHLTGVDRSKYLIRLARRRAKKESLQIAFKEGDARRVRLVENAFDCVAVLGNSFGYFDRLDDDEAVLRNARRCLRSAGTLVLDLTDGVWLREHYEPRSWEWIDQSQFVCRERCLSTDASRLICREVVVDAEKGVIADQFYAERLFSNTEISELLERTGFEAPRFHGEYDTPSDRQQDLGMMSKRMLITAAVPLKVATSPARGLRYPKVTVLLGDPRLPDAVKLDGQFNTDDIATVERLKSALTGLDEYTFRHFDNHGMLLKELERERPEFVFNLCDEGFNNRAALELHVPAYLEMLGVPYSGSDPVCLGLCYDKGLVSSIARELEVPVPLETHVAPDDMGGTLPAIFPALIKPCHGDSSIGITQNALVHDAGDAVRYLNFLRDTLPGRSVLVQEYLMGTEYSVGVIGNPRCGYTILPILEVDYSGLPEGLPPILCYESKWQPDSPYWTAIKYAETDAPEAVQRAMSDHSTRLFERLGCRDYARFDFRADANGEPKLLEVNPNPGWCWDGKFNLMAEMAGHSYGELLRMILLAAEQRLVSGQSNDR